MTQPVYPPILVQADGPGLSFGINHVDKKNFIFLDMKGKRWPRFRLTSFIVVFVSFIALILFIRSLLILPRLQQLDKVHNMTSRLKAITRSETAVHSPEPPPAWLLNKPASPSAVKGAFVNPGDQRPVRLGYYVNWDKNSYLSLINHADKLTHLCPEWFTLAGTPPMLDSEPDEEVCRIAEAHGIALLPLMSNLKIDQWQPEAVEALILSDEEIQDRFFAKLCDRLTKIGAKGLVVDFEQVDPTYQQELTLFFSRMHENLMHKDLELWLCIPVGNDIKIFDLDKLPAVVDRFVAMLYDETGEEDPPGPLASHNWFKEWLDVLADKIPPGQLVIGIGSYGYDWQAGETPQTLSFPDSMARANSAGETRIENMAPYDGPHFDYVVDGLNHSVWFLDAISFRNQKFEAEKKGVRGVALWRMGTEDPQVWDTFNCVNFCEPGSFEEMKATKAISNIGKGDFLTAVNETAEGLRNISQDETGLWSSIYVRYPKYPLLYHQGESRGDQVAITFDDGPNPEWTPKVLDILRQKGVKAGFFITGSNAESHPDLVRRISAEGHEIGNHTYSHPDLGRISQARLQLEFNATQRLIEGITGRSTVLFRPPYNADRLPQSIEEFMTLVDAQGLGYMPVSASIDAEDWKEPGTKAILDLVKDSRREGNIVLLHDAGGDRSQTVEALPAVIDYLRMRGDEIVPLNTLISVPVDSLMPPIPKDDPYQSRLVAQTGLKILHILEELAWAFMIASTAIVFFRTLIVLVFAVRHKLWKETITDTYSITEPVSVIIAAFNESKLIRATLLSVLDTAYRGKLEVVVVDDGSTDNTARIVEDIAAADPRVRLVRQENKGKASALNAGLEATENEYIITLDADTHFNRDTIGRLVAFFADNDVGAVSGHARVGNLGTWIGRFQSLEYTCGFNLDRRAYDVLNCITVVPGAVSALRRSAVLKSGGIPTETLAEDTDMTLNMHRHGYKIRYSDGAIGLTEAPETVKALIRQRTRWAFGTLQCLFKHIDMLFDPAYSALAFFSLPTVWFCHVFLVALVPVVDALLIASLVTGAGGAIAEYALMFILLDLVLALVACMMEGERLRTAWAIIPMRLIYRPLLSYAVWRSLFRALRGVWVGWGRQERRGTVPFYSVEHISQDVDKGVTKG
ncbi:Polysaccharide deacetylase [uncultured Desulfobacterium sp.]|uniref:Polysaccharide deacetylase n=1 Tax=uncultured Desulfobacterium sp. TaxID=201089 RepID=A0A445MWR2_9BACT|nr:Polysaccharide deacetylase [uncultured Desulfobacterium sp.]